MSLNKQYSKVTKRIPTGHRRGSALLMVVGLLTILAMLGTSFLLIARMDARTSKAMANKNSATPLAKGIVDALKAELVKDLYLDDTTGPFGKIQTANGGATGQTLWNRYIDYSSDDCDKYLYGTQVSKLLGDSTAADICTWTDQTGASSDAHLYDSGIANLKDKKYWYAVTVRDTSGMISLNSAVTNDSAKLITPVTPVNIGLEQFLGNSLLKTRGITDGAEATLSNIASFNANAAQRLLTPAGSYTPFSIGDEMLLRWLSPNNIAAAFRLGVAMPGLAADNATARAQRWNLTTFNCSRKVLRYPEASAKRKEALLYNAPATDGSCSLQTDKAVLHGKILAMLTALNYGSSGTVRNKMATHFVANYAAYRATDMSGWPWEYTNGSHTAYGLMDYPVITEAYAEFVQSSKPEGDPDPDHKWFAAIEIFSPSDPKATSLTYKIGSTNIAPPTSGNRTVFYNMSSGSTLNDFSITAGSNWVQCSEVEFYGEKTIKLSCTNGSTEIVIDEVSSGSTELDHSAKNPTDASEKDCIKRDDSISRCRYNIAAYSRDATATTANLGAANNLANTTLASTAKFSTPVVKAANSSKLDYGDLLNIYLTGPYKSGSDKVPFTKAIMKSSEADIFGNTLARGRLDTRGLFDSGSNEYSCPGSHGTGVKTYPGVPKGCMFNEFFCELAPDTQREESSSSATRVYGRININTASAEVLQRLPWPATITMDGTSFNVNSTLLANYIVSYRDKVATSDGQRNYSTRPAAGGSGISGQCNDRGFMTPGEIAIPLGDYFNTLIGVTDYVNLGNSSNLPKLQHKDYIKARNKLYGVVCNLITVNSDTFAANIVIRLKDGTATPPTWYYSAFIDRSNCFKEDDQPAVLLFTPLR